MGLAVVVTVTTALTVIWAGVVLAFAPANPADVFASGILHHTNSRAGSAILTAYSIRPGDTVQGTVTIANDGDLVGAFLLTTSNLSDTAGANGGKLSSALHLQIVDQTTGIIIYSGPVVAVGIVALGTYAPGASRTYLFSVTFPDGGRPASATTGDNAYKGSSMSIQFDWIQAQ